MALETRSSVFARASTSRSGATLDSLPRPSTRIKIIAHQSLQVVELNIAMKYMVCSLHLLGQSSLRDAPTSTRSPCAAPVGGGVQCTRPRFGVDDCDADDVPPRAAASCGRPGLYCGCLLGRVGGCSCILGGLRTRVRLRPVCCVRAINAPSYSRQQ